jgi:hypothetical protein
MSSTRRLAAILAADVVGYFRNGHQQSLVVPPSEIPILAPDRHRGASPRPQPVPVRSHARDNA